MSDNEKQGGMNAGNDKASEFSIESILAEYASPSAKNGNDDTAPHREADFIDGKEAEVAALYNEVVINGGSPKPALKVKDNADNPANSSTVVFGSTGESHKISETHSVKELFDAINEITGTNDAVSDSEAEEVEDDGDLPF